MDAYPIVPLNDDHFYQASWAVLDPDTGERYGSVHYSKLTAMAELARQRAKPYTVSLTLAHLSADGTITYHEDY